MLAALVAFAPSAAAVTTPGATIALVNPEQPIRDASSAIPVVGFGMVADAAGEALDGIAVSFSGAGFSPGDDRDLRALDVDSAFGGVGLYRDDGTSDDILDAADTPVMLDGIAWVGLSVIIDLTANNEPIPTTATGQFEWLIVIRTADVPGALAGGDRIIVTIPANGIVATSGAGFVAQPAADVTSSPLIVLLTRNIDMLGGADQWIGPASATLNEMAVLGLTIVDGGEAPNAGIDDRIVRIVLTLNENAGQVTATDFQPLSIDSATSGIGLYADVGTVEDAWDAGDLPITLASISPLTFGAGGVSLTLTLPGSGLAVPDRRGVEVDFFFVVRTASIVTGDEFDLQVRAGDITVNGLLGAVPGSVDHGLTTPLNLGIVTQPSSLVMGDATPPRLRNLAWDETSGTLAALGLDLYFTHDMTTVQTGSVTGEARDDDSGLASIAYSAEPSLASSPAGGILAGAGFWVPWSGAYGFDAQSLDVDSPAVVSVTDMVGNVQTTQAIGQEFAYIFTATSLVITPNPGWEIVSGTGAWIADDGTLWFSDLIDGTAVVRLTVDLLDVFGDGLLQVNASAEPSLAGGPNPASETFPGNPAEATWSTEYELAFGSTDASSPVAIRVSNVVGISESLVFVYAEDTTPPAPVFLSPAAGATLSGEILLRASVSDAGSGVEGFWVAVDPQGPWVPLLFDGQNYFAPLSTAAYADGPHRLLLRAVDEVGNERVIGIDVLISNAAADVLEPIVTILAPVPSSQVQGPMVLQFTAIDERLLANVSAELVSAGGSVVYSAVLPAGADPLYAISLDSRAFADGDYVLRVTATDAAGNQASALLPFTIDNSIAATLTLLDVLAMAILALLVLLAVLAVLMFRRRREPQS